MTGDLPESLQRLNVSRETLKALARLDSLVRKWTPAINLVAKSTVPHILDRHIADSAQLFELAPTTTAHWLDLGSGGGFPGLVVAIMAQERLPAMTVTLIESDLRKATFLREAARSLDLKVAVLSQRIETAAPQAADVVSARALAPLGGLLSYAARHLKPAGLGIFPKGEGFEAEVTAARADWKFEVDSLPSLSDSRAAILMIRNIQRADQR
jgi:16S rRNA (guanine527-N7)-methyltransferase